MIIKLSKDCRIDASDGLQFTIQTRELITDRAVGGKVSKRAGELSEWKNRGYYGSLVQALNGVLRRTLVVDAHEVSVTQLRNHIDQVAAHLEKSCEGVVTARSAAELEGVVDIEGLDAMFSEAT